MSSAKIVYVASNAAVTMYLSNIVNGRYIPYNLIKNPPVFFHMPKTGGNSVGKFLSQRRIPVITITHNLRDPEYKLPCEVLSGMERSFCFVRNPWDRLVSAYYFLRNGGKHGLDKADFDELLAGFKDFESFVMEGLSSDPGKLLGQIHLKPQVSWIKKQDGKLCINDTLKVEDMRAELIKYFRKFGLRMAGDMPFRNKSRRERDYRKLYSTEMVEVVASVYCEDVETFGYSYE